jgi:hypothetical protein
VRTCGQHTPACLIATRAQPRALCTAAALTDHTCSSDLLWRSAMQSHPLPVQPAIRMPTCRKHTWLHSQYAERSGRPGSSRPTSNAWCSGSSWHSSSTQAWPSSTAPRHGQAVQRPGIPRQYSAQACLGSTAPRHGHAVQRENSTVPQAAGAHLRRRVLQQRLAQRQQRPRQHVAARLARAPEHQVEHQRSAKLQSEVTQAIPGGLRGGRMHGSAGMRIAACCTGHCGVCICQWTM